MGARQQVIILSLDDYVLSLYSWNIAECDLIQNTTPHQTTLSKDPKIFILECESDAKYS